MIGKIIFVLPSKIHGGGSGFALSNRRVLFLGMCPSAARSVALKDFLMYDERGFEKARQLDRLEDSIAVCHSTL